MPGVNREGYVIKRQEKSAPDMLISIGGITLSSKEAFDIGMDNCYRKFLATTDDPPLLLFQRSQNLEHKSSYNQRFDSTGLWSMRFNSIRDFRIDIRGPEGGTVASVSVMMDEGRGVVVNPSKKEPWYSSLPFRYPVDELIFINILPVLKGILLHACGIDDSGTGYLFSGFSGAGKSTMARQWVKAGNKLLNDDRMIIREIDGQFYVFGTPWHGELSQCEPDRVRLKALFLIRHGQENMIKSIRPAEAVAGVIARSFLPFWDKEGLELAVGLIESLVRHVPSYELSFYPDEDVIKYIRGLEI